ncbi:MAG: hypothetical protein RJB63_198 [Actinomycetota bacterium]
MTQSVTSEKLRQRRVPALDGVRGYAVLLVVISHVTMNVFPGYIGVDIFFVLSGFLITNLLTIESKHTKTINYLQFLKRRFLRLYPSLVLTVLIAAVVYQILWGVNRQFFADAIVALTYLEPWFIAIANWDGGLFRHTWSLGLEEFFYLLWPIVFVFLGSISRNKAIGVLTIGLVVLVIPIVASLTADFEENPTTSYLLRFGGILLGCYISLANFKVGRALQLALLAAALTGLVASMLPMSPGVGSLVAAVSSCGLIVSLAQPETSNKLSAKLFENPMILWVGKVSYEPYLVHYVLIVLTIWWLAGQSTSEQEIRLALVPVGLASVLVAYFVHIIQKRIRSLRLFGVTPEDSIIR